MSEVGVESEVPDPGDLLREAEELCLTPGFAWKGTAEQRSGGEPQAPLLGVDFSYDVAYSVDNVGWIVEFDLQSSEASLGSAGERSMKFFQSASAAQFGSDVVVEFDDSGDLVEAPLVDSTTGFPVVGGLGFDCPIWPFDITFMNWEVSEFERSPDGSRETVVLETESAAMLTLVYDDSELEAFVFNAPLEPASPIEAGQYASGRRSSALVRSNRAEARQVSAAELQSMNDVSFLE